MGGGGAGGGGGAAPRSRFGAGMARAGALLGAAAPASGRMVLWAPIWFSFGILAFFHGARDPSAWTIAMALALAVACAPMAARGPRALMFPFLALALTAGGFAAASLRAHAVAAPVLERAMDATVEGRVAVLSRSRGDAPRAELTDVVIYGVARERTPARVRVTLMVGDFERPVRVGQRIALYARISPPGAPVEPGGFDFRRLAWFQGLGAVGYARGPILMAETRKDAGAADALARAIGELRDRIATAIMEAIPGERGAFAAAILVGSRAGVGQEPLQALRDSNLAHLLAISGLHMGLMAGLAFGAVRLALAMVPAAALRLPSKKVAAGAALAVATGYLLLSGAAVATQRAYVMAAVALIAVMIDRPPVSLRALAAAALAILIARPESLMDAGFQMSFAATTALVAAWETSAGRRARQAGESGARGAAVLRWALALAFTSLVAGIATAPFSAMIFNRLSHFGFAANLAAVPVMGFVTMPSAVAAALLTPLGLQQPALWVMGESIGFILAVARWAADLPGAVRTVVQPSGAVAPLIVLGGLWLCLGVGRARGLGAAPLALGLALWWGAPSRPPLLIAPEGELLGLLGPEGRAVDRPRGSGYAVTSWLASDGDGADQAAAAARPGLIRDGRAAHGDLGGGWRVMRLGGRPSAAALGALCTAKLLLVVPGGPSAVEGACVYLGPRRLSELGALAVEVDGERLRIRSALAAASGRLWTGPPPDPP
jgi:competence protein ComEC